MRKLTEAEITETSKIGCAEVRELVLRLLTATPHSGDRGLIAMHCAAQAMGMAMAELERGARDRGSKMTPEEAVDVVFTALRPLTLAVMDGTSTTAH